MRLALNLLSAHVGAGIVCNRALLGALARVHAAAEYHVVLGRTQEALARAVPPGFHVHRLRFDSRRLAARLFVEQVVLPFLLWRWQIDVLYSVGNLTTLVSPCPTVVVVENANPFSIFRLRWTWQQRLRNIVLRHLSRASAKRAWRVRFVSQTSRDALVPHLGIQPDKTFVIPHAAGPWDEIQPEDGLPPRFVLTVSSLAPHKNLERLIQAFARLVGEGSYEGSLLIVGAPVDRSTVRAVERLLERLGLERRVTLLGEVPHERLAGLYRRADAFVTASLEETFGLPVLEAMGFGVPVVVGEFVPARAGSCLPFREICGDAALYCDPLSPESIAEALARAVSDRGVRTELTARAKARAALFTWDETARALKTVFRVGCLAHAGSRRDH